MKIIVRNVLSNAQVDIDRADCSTHMGEDQAILLLCRSQATLTMQSGICALCWPVRGSALLSTGEYSLQFDTRSAYMTDAQRSHEMFVCADAFFLTLLATPAGWRHLLSGQRRTPHGSTAVPALHALSPTLRRQLLRALREALTSRASMPDVTVGTRIGAVLRGLQQPFVAQIARCPGRTAAKQTNVFMRLQRVRNMLSLSTDSELEIGDLARAANYSPWRFIRVFSQVFGETPYAYVSRCRIDRAHNMLLRSSAAVSDVAAAVGFETRAAMTRAIRKRYGVSAIALRATALQPADGGSF